jgi:hypothetical protein
VLATAEDAQLAANGTGQDLDINATVDSGRHTTLLARRDILQSADVTAGGTIDAQAFNGSILMDPDVVSDADDDNIRYTAEMDVELGILDAGTGNVAITATAGSIRDVQDDLVDVDGDGFATNTGRTVNIIGPLRELAKLTTQSTRQSTRWPLRQVEVCMFMKAMR